jgi:hypothetical protein
MHIDTRAAPGLPRGGVVFTRPRPGYSISMTDDRTDRRAADLLPEERAAGSDDPQAQAAAILADSDDREDRPNAAPDTFLERRSSEETVEVRDTTR